MEDRILTNPVSSSQKHCFWAECPNEDQASLTLMKCSKCKTALYCSTSCQRKDWSQHKIVCVEKNNLQKDEDILSVVMKQAKKALLFQEKHKLLMESIEKSKSRLALISQELGSPDARLEGEKIFKDAQNCLSEMIDPDWSKVEFSNPKTFAAKMTIEEGFEKLESLKEKAENFIKEYSCKKPPSIEGLTENEKEELLFKTIDDNISQIDVVSDRILFLISNGCGLVEGNFSERVKQKVELIKDFNLKFEINMKISMKSGLFL
ncbi:MAG: hypothetical protein K1060chlam4_00117 [Candidatus Anoxychlamydiales bacterium]|nr:hypothetical protein [Candidatus Anoxychlamydiales bacterium]